MHPLILFALDANCEWTLGLGLLFGASSKLDSIHAHVLCVDWAQA